MKQRGTAPLGAIDRQANVYLLDYPSGLANPCLTHYYVRFFRLSKNATSLLAEQRYKVTLRHSLGLPNRAA